MRNEENGRRQEKLKTNGDGGFPVFAFAVCCLNPESPMKSTFSFQLALQQVAMAAG